jgi:hypothetical protein
MVVLVLLTNIAVGIFSTSKEGIAEPIVFFLVMAVLRYGFKDRRVWALCVTGAISYTAFIYPYSQYIRSNGGREGSMSSRVGAMEGVIGRMASDPDFRSSMHTVTAPSREGYLGRQSLEPFDRFAMLGLADLLVSGTNDSEFTGWQTITLGFKLMVPSFLYPDKPIFSAGNFLGHIAGEVGVGDETTQCAYGFMANFYNAFSFPGVFFGTALCFALFYYILRWGFGNPRWRRRPGGSTVWMIVLIAAFHHTILESAVSGLMPQMMLPVVVFCFYSAAKVLVVAMDVFSGRSERRKRDSSASYARYPAGIPIYTSQYDHRTQALGR